MEGQPSVLLLVEDHDDTRRVMRAIFSRRGWKVLAGATVAEGLSHLEHGPLPDWIILDLMLPDGEGERILEKVRSEGSGVRVAVTTATYDPDRLGGLSALEPDLLLTKPIDLAALCRAMETQPSGARGARAHEWEAREMARRSL